MRRVLPLLLGVLFATPQVSAQELSLAGAIVHARYGDSVSGTATAASSRFRSTTRRSNLALDAALSSFTTGEIAFNAAATAARIITESARGAIGVTATTSYGSVEGTPWTGTAAAGLVGARSLGTALISVAVSGGAARSIGRSSFGLATAGVGLSHRVTENLVWFTGVGGTAADTISYVDFTAGASYQPDGFELGLNFGARAGELPGTPWAGVFLAKRVSPGVTLEIGTGWYPQDYIGFTDGYFFSGSLRVFPTPRFRPQPRSRAVTSAVRVSRSDNDSVSIVIAQDGDRVELVGEFNDWTPTPMSRLAPGLWEAVLDLVPGVYQFALVVDGDWTIPDAVPAIDDGMGGRSGLLTVR